MKHQKVFVFHISKNLSYLPHKNIELSVYLVGPYLFINFSKKFFQFSLNGLCLGLYYYLSNDSKIVILCSKLIEKLEVTI